MDRPRRLACPARRLRQRACEGVDVVALHVPPHEVVHSVAFGIEGGGPVVPVNHADHEIWVGVASDDDPWQRLREQVRMAQAIEPQTRVFLTVGSPNTYQGVPGMSLLDAQGLLQACPGAHLIAIARPWRASGRWWPRASKGD